MKRKAFASLIVSAVVAFTGIVAASPASATVSIDRFQAVGTTLCLDGYSTRQTSDIYVTGCNTGPFQKWRWDNVGETWLDSQASGQGCMQWTGGYIQLEPCRLIPAQYWVVALPQIKKDGTNLCLGRLGGQNSHVVVERCNGLINQQWRRA